MKWNLYLATCLLTCVLATPNLRASISGQSLYLIVSNGLQAAQTIKAKPTDINALKQFLASLAASSKSSKPVPPGTETEARHLLSGIATTYGNDYRSAFFSTFSLPSQEQAKEQAYPRPGRVRVIVELIAKQRAETKYDAAYRNRVLAAAQKKVGRPANGETVTLYINKRKVSGQIHYHENTFDIGIVTFPNEDLPPPYRLDLIRAKTDEFMDRHFSKKRDAYQKKLLSKLFTIAMRSGNYLHLSGEWFSPETAYPALSYFLRRPEDDKTITIKNITPVPVLERIKAGENPTSEALVASLIRMIPPRSKDDNKQTLTPEAYTLLLTYWKNSLVARNTPTLSKGLPLSDAPGDDLHKAARLILQTTLMEP